jgi:hypothetical protein
MTNEPAVFRSIAFPLSAFDYLKQFQRDYQERHGVSLNNNQALAVILEEHQKQFNIELSGEQNANKETSRRRINK